MSQTPGEHASGTPRTPRVVTATKAREIADMSERNKEIQKIIEEELQYIYECIWENATAGHYTLEIKDRHWMKAVENPNYKKDEKTRAWVLKIVLGLRDRLIELGYRVEAEVISGAEKRWIRFVVRWRVGK